MAFRQVRAIRGPGGRLIIVVALVVSAAGATTSSLHRRQAYDPTPDTSNPSAARIVWESGESEEGENGGVVREPMAWGCSGDATAVSPAARRDGVRIPPSPLKQDISDLRIGRPFPAVAPHNLPILPGQLAGVEQEFCKRDAELLCPTGADRERIVGDVLQRTARIAANAGAASTERAAAQHVNDDLRHNRIPVVQFNTGMRNGPTAAILRYQDSRTRKWVLGIAFAKDFVSAGENSLFLDGVMVQEMVHYDDLSFLPDPLRCYESNIEIRGHYAMIRYWTQQRHDTVKAHPRISLVMRAGLDAASSRAKWYRYLNQVEKTDFLVEDELVSLEFQSIPALSSERDDTRFLAELTQLVSSAISKASYVRSHAAILSADSINANARVISAVSRLMPRVVARYERSRGEIKESDGSTRLATLHARVADIRRSLATLDGLMGMLAANPDFRQKSDFVGPE